MEFFKQKSIQRENLKGKIGKGTQNEELYITKFMKVKNSQIMKEANSRYQIKTIWSQTVICWRLEKWTVEANVKY